MSRPSMLPQVTFRTSVLYAWSLASFVILASYCALVGGPFSTAQVPIDSPPEFSRAIALEWDPSGSTVAGYRLLVGTSSGAYTDFIDVGNTTRFVYTAAEPWRNYYFGVVAYTAEGVTSEPSNEAVWSIGPIPDPRRAPTVGAVGPSEPIPADAARFCFAPGGTDCYAATVVARGRGLVNSLAATPDGRLFFIEDGRAVRVVGPSGLLDEPALRAGDRRGRIDGLVVDPGFARTRHVYIGEVSTDDMGAGEMSLVRYREAGNVLGERASVVSGLPVAVAQARVAIDNAGRLYVALPSGDGTTARPVSTFSGKVLRFNSDGTTPRESPSGSPVLAEGFAAPSGLEWDLRGRRLRLSGQHPDWPHSVAHIPLERWETRGWAPAPLPDLAESGLEGYPFRVVTLAAGPLPSRELVEFFVDSAYRLVRFNWPGPEVRPQVSALTGPPYAVMAATAGADGTLFIAVRPADTDPGNPIFEILRLQ